MHVEVRKTVPSFALNLSRTTGDILSYVKSCWKIAKQSNHRRSTLTPANCAHCEIFT